MKIEPKPIRSTPKAKVQDSTTVEHSSGTGTISSSKGIVNLSDDTVLVKKAMDSIRSYEAAPSEKVARLKEEIASGSYKVDEDALARILEEKL
ncbi:MAG: flagellar biosynthesis anti-sigma factor FlgM [Candidatus Xenobiia bacterium LiM19]